jgi:hypothetical protein
MTKSNSLSDYTWGIGIEHEMHVFHMPKLSRKNIIDFTLFDSYSVVQRILSENSNGKSNLTYDERELLKKIPFEVSGRRCNEEWVIKPVPIKMPELITFSPFCSIKNNRNLINFIEELKLYKKMFYNILMKDSNTQKLIKNYGILTEYPFGMTRYLKYPISQTNGKYLFEKDKNGKDLLVPEYNGSYHITFTLPYKESTTQSEFIKMHQNFCNQLQWIEPLLLTSYFTGDEYSPGELKKRVRGSFRVMIIGWGNFAGTDIRLLKKGIGRYAKTPTYWRKGLNFIDVDKLKPCYKPSPSALKEGATSSLSSDFRTFGSTDPLRPDHRESGVGMTKPNGVEFRIFDHFNDANIDSLVQLIALFAENSRVTKTKGYVYKNKVWIETMHAIMTYGYKTELSKKYIKLLREKLGLKINTKSIIAIDVFKTIFRELIDKNVNGKWMKIFNTNKSSNLERKKNIIPYMIPDINKKGWQFAFMMKLNRNAGLMNKFKLLSRYISNQTLSFNDFSDIIIKFFGKKWGNDIVDIAYFYNDIYRNNIILEKNENGTIKNIICNNALDNININDKIIDYFNYNKLSNILF